MTRYTITADARPGAKARLRTALKLMGFESIRIVEADAAATAPKPRPDNLPTSALARQVADLYKRDHSTPWSDAEIAEFRKAVKRGVITDEAVRAIASHYHAERKKEDHYCRRDLLRFLRHFDGELDRARAVKPGRNRALEWGDGAARIVALPPPDEAEAERVRAAALEQGRAFREGLGR